MSDKHGDETEHEHVEYFGDDREDGIGTAERLAELLGGAPKDFRYEGPIPEFDEQEVIVPDEDDDE